MERYLQPPAVDFDFRTIDAYFETKFLRIVNSDAIADELADSIAYVMQWVPKKPVGA